MAEEEKNLSCSGDPKYVSYIGVPGNALLGLAHANNLVVDPPASVVRAGPEARLGALPGGSSAVLTPGQAIFSTRNPFFSLSQFQPGYDLTSMNFVYNVINRSMQITDSHQKTIIEP